jgi:hypothetical protein
MLIQTIPINLDKTRNLKLTLGGMKRFADVTGKSLLKGFNFNDMSETELIAFIWACLIWEDRKLTLEDVGFMLDVSKMPEITERLKMAVSVSAPERTDETPLVGTPPAG